MADDKLDRIMESLLGEGIDTNSFVSKIDSINANAYKIRHWDKYRERFGDQEPDDVETNDFRVYWTIDIDFEKDGLYGVSSEIKYIEGEVSLMFYDSEEATEPRIEKMDIEKGDLQGMKIVNEPKINRNNQLLINGVWIDFERKEISIEYL